jgi:hypothetical protein
MEVRWQWLDLATPAESWTWHRATLIHRRTDFEIERTSPILPLRSQIAIARPISLTRFAKR